MSDFERVTDEVWRMKVPNGWIVKIVDWRQRNSDNQYEWIIASSFFVPDENHSWSRQGAQKRLRQMEEAASE